MAGITFMKPASIHGSVLHHKQTLSVNLNFLAYYCVVV